MLLTLTSHSLVVKVLLFRDKGDEFTNDVEAERHTYDQRNHSQHTRVSEKPGSVRQQSWRGARRNNQRNDRAHMCFLVVLFLPTFENIIAYNQLKVRIITNATEARRG